LSEGFDLRAKLSEEAQLERIPTVQQVAGFPNISMYTLGEEVRYGRQEQGSDR
jgi:hypothetical protein